ncbi:hypothetical protein [Mycobacteroides abscessus]|uniref:hypothetical protein n=1 Tax=Mycobacteroides abscessus TaxID=36809 RepID=UPI0002D7AC1E|nr:hypothetical protein [Mycobacteroides abscessus]
MTDRDSAAELERLEQKVRAVTRERMDIERGLSNPAALRSATARAYRDRDAVTSPLLEEARDQIQADVREFHSKWRAIDRIYRDISRLAQFLDEAPQSIRSHRDGIVAELPEVRVRRSQIGSKLASEGLVAILPDGESGNE